MLTTEKIAAAQSAKTTAVQPLPPRYLKIPSAAAYAGLGRSLIYLLMGEGKIKSYKVRGVRLVDRESLDAFISSQ